MNERALVSTRRPWWRADDSCLVNPRSVLALVAMVLTWVFSLTVLQKHPSHGLPESVHAGSRAYPSCGTVESVATLLDPQSSGPLATYFYRLTIRMADGSLQRIEQSAPLAPGSQVLVQGGVVQPYTLQRQ